MKTKESEKINKYKGLARELKKNAVGHEGKGCVLGTVFWGFGKKSGGIGNQKYRDPTDHSTVKID